jgi:hypothetical protein
VQGRGRRAYSGMGRGGRDGLFVCWEVGLVFRQERLGMCDEMGRSEEVM